MELYQTLQSLVTSNNASWKFLIPEYNLLFFFLLGLLIDLFFKNKKWLAGLMIVGISFSGFLTFQQISASIEIQQLFNGMLILSNKIIVFKLLITLVVGLFIIFASTDYRIKKQNTPEYFYLAPLFLIALNMLCMSAHMLTIYLSVEMVSLFSYGYVALSIKDKSNAESGMKYILFGLLASDLLLYGISLMYGFSGTLSLQDPNFLAWFAKAPMPIIALSIGLIMAGFLFKIAAAPFHFYAPDVFQGTSATTLVLLSVAPKIAGYALFANFLGFFSFKIFNQVLFWPMYNWETFLSITAIMTLVIGSFVALSQTNIKRLMAYAGIAQSGFLLMGLIGYTSIGVIALLFYLLAYLLMNTAAFMLISYFEQQHEAYDLADYKGLVRKAPLASILLVVVFASFIGLPPLVGFTGKFLLFSASYQAYVASANPAILITIITAAVASIVSLFYYFIIIRNMFMQEATWVKVNKEEQNILYLLVLPLILAIIYFGILPSNMISYIQSIIA